MRDRKRGTVRDLRRDNRAAVLWSLYLGQPCSRQDLSMATGLSAASVTNVIRELLDEGIVIETGLEDSDGGRPRAVLGMNPGYGYVIGVDTGETRTRGELFYPALPVPPGGGPRVRPRRRHRGAGDHRAGTRGACARPALRLGRGTA